MEFIKNIMINESNFWIGTEVEGRYKGIKTLFVVGDQKVSKIQNYLLDNNIYHIYFGAGNQSIVNNFDTIRFFIERGYIITYELEEKDIDKIPNDIIKNIHIIITYKSNELIKLKSTDTIKVEDSKNVYCSSIENMFYTDKNNDYEDDKML